MTTPAITLVPRARPVVELGVGDTYTPVGTGQWHVSRWGQASATWVGIEPIWLDISCYVQDISTFVGHERSTDSWRIGTATVVLNNESGWADYPPTDPLAHPLLTVRPGRQVRIGVYIDNAVDPLWLWRGYTDEATPDYSPDAEPTVTLTCIDAKGEVGRTGIAKLAATTGASETVTDRINRILNAANWSVYRRSLDASGAELIATELGAKAADLLDIAADSGGGSVFGDNDGKIAYRNRDWQMYETGTPVDGTIGNVEGDVCPNAWETSFARADMATRVHVARHTDNAPVTASDDAAIALYGVETYERLDLETEATINLVSLAFRHLAVRSHTTLPRIVSVDLDASRAGVLDLLAIADPRIAPRFRCRHVVGTRTVFDREMFAVAIEHKINADTWTARISLDDAAAYLFAGGTWGSARWQRALWAS